MLGAALVDRATSPVLVGPDLSVNMELCDVLNSNSSQVKDVVRRMKKQLNSKHSKVQLLTLTLLETIIKNCGDVVHMHVAEKDILHEMVKIVKKKPDFHVKEKILVLIDTWQEAFGGPRARYPQYYVAYQELLRAGVVFPQRLESSVPIFTPPQTKPLSYPQPVRKPETYSGAPESSARFDLSTLSTTEIQNARSVVDILAEMISAMDPTNKEGLKQEVIVDLVEQCRSYKQRVIQLVNSSSDERLLSQGLALHDDIQRVLAQRDAIASGIAVKVEKQMPVAGTPKVEIKAKEPQTNGRISTTASNASGSSSVAQSFPPATTSSNGPIIPPARVPQIDLLSGDFNPAEDENRLALVPVSIYSTTSTSDQNTLALIDMFPQNTVMDNRSSNSISPSYSTSHAHVTSSNAQMTSPPKLNLSPSFNGASPASPQFGGPYPIPINQPNMQQMKPLNLGNVDIRNGLSGEAFPPPPWEMQQADGNQPGRTAKTLQPAQVAQMGGAYLQQMQQIPQFASGYPPVPNAQMMAISPYQPQGGPVLGSQVQTTQIPGGGYIYERWVIPPADAQYYDQMRPQYPYPYPYLAASNLSPRAYGTAIQGGTNLMNVNPSYSTVLPSPLSSKQFSRPSRPEDKLFGDLVDFAKLKQNKPSR